MSLTDEQRRDEERQRAAAQQLAQYIRQRDERAASAPNPLAEAGDERQATLRALANVRGRIDEDSHSGR